MIIIQKNFSDPHNSHEQVMNFVNEMNGFDKNRDFAEAVRYKPSHELTRTQAVNPAHKDAMVEADKKHDFEESMSAYLDDLKSNGWNLRQPSSTSSKESATSSVSTEEKGSESKSTAAAASTPKKTASSSNPTKKETETSAVKVESSPNNESVTSEGDKGNNSDAVKSGLAMAGTAALAAGGFAAYKAWKKRREKKAAIDAEVSGFLNDKYKTDK